MSREELERLLDRLPERDRIPLILRHLNGFTTSQVAAALGLSVSTVGKRLRSVHRKLLAEAPGAIEALQALRASREKGQKTALQSGSSAPQELVIDLQVPADIDKDLLKGHLGDLARALDDVHRAHGGSGLTIETLTIESPSLVEAGS